MASQLDSYGLTSQPLMFFDTDDADATNAGALNGLCLIFKSIQINSRGARGSNVFFSTNMVNRETKNNVEEKNNNYA